MRTRKYGVWAVILLILVLVAVTSGSVLAYLSNKSGTVTATMKPAVAADPQISLGENQGDVIASNLSVEVPENGYPVYVRVAIVVTWEDESSNASIEAPVQGEDYAFAWNETDWFERDGFYYHISSVASGEASAVLIYSLVQLNTDTVPDGYTLHVEVIAQTIQALGTVDGGITPAVTDAWKVNVDSNGNLIP